MVQLYTLSTVAIIGFTGCCWMYIKTKKQRFEAILHTNCYKDSIAALKSHHGAIKYLGEPMKECDKELLVTDISKISDEIKRHEVYVPIKGAKTTGILYFYVNQNINNPENFYVDNIELQIGYDTGRRLVIQKSKSNAVEYITEEVVENKTEKVENKTEKVETTNCQENKSDT